MKQRERDQPAEGARTEKVEPGEEAGSEEFLPLWNLVGPEIVRIYEPHK